MAGTLDLHIAGDVLTAVMRVPPLTEVYQPSNTMPLRLYSGRVPYFWPFVTSMVFITLPFT